MNRTADYYIEKLKLQAHPEGGYYKESFRDESSIGLDRGPRSTSTAIYYLLKKDQISKLHRIKSAEVWHFYDGGPLTIVQLLEDGTVKRDKLGLDLVSGCRPQIVVPACLWFGAYMGPEAEFCLAGCTVAPGFDYKDFEMANGKELKAKYQEQAELISRLSP